MTQPPIAELTESSTDLHTLVESQSPATQFETLRTVVTSLVTTLCDDVLTPVAKRQYERDRGQSVTQVLPDRTDDYEFSSDHFGVLVLPDERAGVNHTYDNTPVTVDRVMRDPQWFTDASTAAKSLWESTFGSYSKHRSQPNHPGEYPLAQADNSALVSYTERLYTAISSDKSLEVVAAVAQAEQYGLLADLFGTTQEEILTPGGTDLAAIPRSDSLHVPYNDGEVAVIRPTQSGVSVTGGSPTPTRGVVIGHDDTPVGLFAHVVDVTNLDPDQYVSRSTVRAALGFDRELNPWDHPNQLSLDDDTRLRLQGDLRIERLGDVAGFADEVARRSRIQEYRQVVTDVLDSVEVGSQFVWGESADVPTSRILDPTVSPNGSVSIDPLVDDLQVELLAYVSLLRQLDAGPSQEYDTYDDIPYIDEPSVVRRSFARGSLPTAVSRGLTEVTDSLKAVLSRQQQEIESDAREDAAEVKAGIEAPQQVNLPVDNHLAFIEDGVSPDVETEPVPVAVPQPTTLHIEHSEHNTVTVQITPGVYRFSLLPRGLQPPESRFEWPNGK